METPFLSKSSLSIPSNLPVFAFVKIANLHKKSVKVHGVVLFLEGIYKKNQKKMFFSNENNCADDNGSSGCVKITFFAVYTCQKNHYRMPE